MDEISSISAFVQSVAGREVPFRSELARCIPIGTVACVEGYFRMVFRDLIDAGSPFRENISTHFKELRLGIDHVVALQSKRVTLGEFVGHLLPASGVDDLHESMSTLIGEPFLDRLKVTKAEYFRDEEAKSLDEHGIWADFMRDLKTLFEWRHIFAHELATNYKIRHRQIAIDHAQSGQSLCTERRPS